jgi:carotenoid 1,2-hydratase
MTLIAFIGSVFSPYYAWAKHPADPENHVAINVALYGSKHRWAMTERGRTSLKRGRDFLRIGPSGLHRDGDTLVAEIDEISTPVLRRLRGTVRLTPGAIQPETFVLDAAGRHRWRPIAPLSRVQVEFRNPELSWSGRAYFDTNHGDVPLAADFCSWHWSRTASPETSCILYDVARRDGTELSLALRIGEDGLAERFNPPPQQRLPVTWWGVERRTRADAGDSARVLKTFENAPFYARSHIKTRIHGMESEAIHESLSLSRFSTFWVRLLLPFRMPRRARRAK